MPYRFPALIASLILGWVASAGYSIFFNPEVQFWKAAYEKKAQWALELSQKYPNKHVFVGGSSCAFQIDAGLLTTESGIPSVNMGMAAGMESKGVMAIALSVVNPGDTVVVGIEPGLLLQPPSTGALGWQLLLATGAIWNKNAQLALGPIRISDVISSLRPGLRHCVTMGSKLLARRAMYRYSPEEILPGGGLFTEVRNPIEPFKVVPLRLDPATANWLRSLSEASPAIARRWHYLLPLHLFPTAEHDAAEMKFDSFLTQMPASVEPLGTGLDGVSTDKQSFADSALHVTRTGMQIRSQRIGQILHELNR